MTERDFEHVTHFPVKLWDVVNDENCDMCRWSEEGTAFYVDDHRYELEVMDKYPGFVQISSFANLRRLLREYSFDWQTNEKGEFRFTHPYFLKGDRESIFNIRTKRKAIQVAIGQPTKNRRRLDDSTHPANAPNVWMQPATAGKVNLRVDTLLRFPEKFWTVVNDTNDMLYWGDNGDTVIVDDRKYEDGIMTSYPGFVQINSFANLRRLLREYGFSWSIRDNGFFEFSHSHMKRGQEELLAGVKTKRKAMKAGLPHPYLPFFRTDNLYGAHGSKMFTPWHGQFDPFEHTFSASSSEVNQAIGSIQPGVIGYADHQTRYFQHRHGSGDHPMSFYGFPQYKFMPPYGPLQSHIGLQPNSWALPGGGNKMDPSFYYSTWNQDTQLQMPIQGDQQVFGGEEQTSPVTDPKESYSDLRPSSTGSSSSMYASTPKGSLHTRLNDNQTDVSSQETTPSSSAPTMPMRPGEGLMNADTCMNESVAYRATGDESAYQPSYQSFSRVGCDEETPLNPGRKIIKSEGHNERAVDMRARCDREDGWSHHTDLNSDAIRSVDYHDHESIEALNENLQYNQPQNQLLSNAKHLESCSSMPDTVATRL